MFETKPGGAGWVCGKLYKRFSGAADFPNASWQNTTETKLL